MKKITLLLSFLMVQTVLFAQYTAIPDSNFEAALATYDDIPGDNQILTANAAAVTGFLNVSSAGITDLTGIEAFSNITSLKISGNTLSSGFDLSNNLALTDIDAAATSISSIDLSSNINLTKLNVSYNSSLTFLDLTSNPLMEEVNTEACAALATLNLAGLSNLVTLNLYDNDLSSIDVSASTSLETLNVRYNTLSELNLSSNTSIVSVEARNNALTVIDMRNGNNANVTLFNATFNPAPCIMVDDDTEPNLSTWSIDGASDFYEVDGDCPSLSVGQSEATAFTMYPNPAKNTLYVMSSKQTASVEIYSVTGKLVMKKSLNFGQNTINISALKSGMYLTKFTSNDKATLTKKLVIK